MCRVWISDFQICIIRNHGALIMQNNKFGEFRFISRTNIFVFPSKCAELFTFLFCRAVKCIITTDKIIKERWDEVTNDYTNMKREFVAVMSRDVLNFIALSNPLEEYQLVKFFMCAFLFVRLVQRTFLYQRAIGFECSSGVTLCFATQRWVIKITLKILFVIVFFSLGGN